MKLKRVRIRTLENGSKTYEHEYEPETEPELGHEKTGWLFISVAVVFSLTCLLIGILL